MNIQRKTLTEIADEICDLFDNLGFTSENPIDNNYIIGEIVKIIEEGYNCLNEEPNGGPFEIPNINWGIKYECGCENLPANPLEK